MTVKKGDTIYRKSDGQPIPVVKTRKLQDGATRVYLGHPREGDTFDVQGDTLGTTRYSLTQTPELAQLWADTLKARADERAEADALRERERLFRLANRDALNAPEIVTAPEVQEGWKGEAVLIGVRYPDVTRDGLNVEIVERFYSVSVYDTPVNEVDESGNWKNRRVWGVNWSALGTQSPAVARAYARAILAAADLAESRPLTPDPIGEN